MTWKRFGSAFLAVCMLLMLFPASFALAVGSNITLALEPVSPQGWYENESGVKVYGLDVVANVSGANSFEMLSGQVSIHFDPSVLTLNNIAATSYDGVQCAGNSNGAANGDCGLDFTPSITSPANVTVNSGSVLGTLFFVPASEAAASRTAVVSFTNTSSKPTEFTYLDADSDPLDPPTHTVNSSAAFTVPARNQAQTPVYAVSITGDNTIQAGTNKTYTAAVTADGNPVSGASVAWSVSPGMTGVQISSAGVLTVDSSVSAGAPLTVTASYTPSGGQAVTATKAVTVTAAAQTPVYAVTITGDDTIQAGSSKNYTAVVTVDGTPIGNASAAWSIANPMTGVRITSSGQLTVDTGVTAGASIPVTASYTPAGGQAVTATKAVTVTAAPAPSAYTIAINGPDTLQAGADGTYSAVVSVDGTPNSSLTAQISMPSRSDGITFTNGVLHIPAGLAANTTVGLNATYTSPSGQTVTAAKTVQVTSSTYAVSITGDDTVQAGNDSTTGNYTAAVSVNGTANPSLLVDFSMDTRTDGITFENNHLSVPATITQSTTVTLRAVYTPEGGQAVTAVKTVQVTPVSSYALVINGDDTVPAGNNDLTGYYVAVLFVNGTPDYNAVPTLTMAARTDGITFDGSHVSVPSSIAADTAITFNASYTTPDGQSLTAVKTVTVTAASNPAIITVMFLVVGGSWDDNTADLKYAYLSTASGSRLVLSESQVPSAGSKPDSDHYEGGSWDSNPVGAVVEDGDLFIFTYPAIQSSNDYSATIKFRVVGGFWSDGSSTDKIVTITGSSASSLYPSASDVPDVGSNPDASHAAGGSWNVSPWAMPSQDGDVYTYTYNAAPVITATVNFAVVGGAWSDGTSANKTVVVSGTSASTLKLSMNQVPIAGLNPDASHVASGSWDKNPLSDVVHDGDVFTYTYNTNSGGTTPQPVQTSYTVTYGPGEGTGTQQTVTVNSGDSITLLPASTFTAPTGKQFKAWQILNNTYNPGTSYVVTANTTITALWESSTTPAPSPDTPTPTPSAQGCYVATAVYGSYDCPEVWTLRRFRDNVLARTWYGRLFIHFYYAVSPTAVRLFGRSQWFQNFFRSRLDPWVASLQADGFASTPYNDRAW